MTLEDPRRGRMVRGVAVPVAVLAVATAIAVALFTTRAPRKLTIPNAPPPTGPTRTITPAAGPATTPRPSAPPATAALDAYLAIHPEAVSHSLPVADGLSVAAVVGLQRSSQVRAIEVIDLGTGTARVVADLVLPLPSYDLSPDLPVQVADITGDSRPDFLVRVVAGDNDPGVVVSDDGGSWHLVREQTTTGAVPSTTDVYLGRDPSISAGRLQSVYNDCNPYCAAGHESTVAWVYDRTGGYFRSLLAKALPAG